MRRSVRPSRPVSAGAQAIGLVALSIALSGCQIAGMMAEVVGGGAKVKPVHELTDRPTVILVDDAYDNPRLPTPDLAPLIADRVGKALVKAEVVTQVVPPSVLGQLRAREEDYHRWPIDRIGKQVGAEQVIYVYVQRFDIVEDGAIYRPQATVTVKLIDVSSHERLWPAGDEGYPVEVDLSYSNMESPSPAALAKMSQLLATQIADRVGKLFYEHTPTPVGERLPG